MLRPAPLARVASPVLALLALAACGDEPAKPQGPAAPAVSPEKLAEELRKLGNDPDALRKAIGAVDPAAGRHVGTDLAAAADRVKELAGRPLTSTDVERYLAVLPKVRAAGATGTGLAAILAEAGLTMPEWGALVGRMTAARIASRLPAENLDARMKADLELLRPYLDRLSPTGPAK